MYYYPKINQISKFKDMWVGGSPSELL